MAEILVVDDEADLEILIKQKFRKKIRDYSYKFVFAANGNLGSVRLKRLDYTVIADVVNTASRLDSAAEPGQIIISEDSYHKVKESFCRGIWRL